jgi:hypothetical protein
MAGFDIADFDKPENIKIAWHNSTEITANYMHIADKIKD